MGVTYSAMRFLHSDGSNVRQARSLLYRFAWSSAFLLAIYSGLVWVTLSNVGLSRKLITPNLLVNVVLGLLFVADTASAVWSARVMGMTAILTCALSNTLSVLIYTGREVWLLYMLHNTRLGASTQHVLVAAAAVIILVKLLTAAALWKVARRLSTGDLAELAVVLRDEGVAKPWSIPPIVSTEARGLVAALGTGAESTDADGEPLDQGELRMQGRGSCDRGSRECGICTVGSSSPLVVRQY